jgi:hypothetical protein
MALFRSRPKLVEAQQWFPGRTFAGVTELFAAGPDGVAQSCGYAVAYMGSGGLRRVSPGDWLVKGRDDLLPWPLTDAAFRAAYEPVEASDG